MSSIRRSMQNMSTLGQTRNESIGRLLIFSNLYYIKFLKCDHIKRVIRLNSDFINLNEYHTIIFSS